MDELTNPAAADRPRAAGDVVTLSRTIASEDLEAFARLSLDRNPLHFDEAFARSTYFGRPIAHGMIGAALLSGALTRLMGDGNAWLSAQLDFKKPVYVGDTVEARLVIDEIDRRGVATIEATVRNQHGDVVVEGQLKSMRIG